MLAPAAAARGVCSPVARRLRLRACSYQQAVAQASPDSALVAAARSRRAALALLSLPLLAGPSRAEGEAAEADAAAGEAAAAAAPEPATAPVSGGVRLLTPEERLLLEQNQRIKSLNRAPDDFPAFIRSGYEVRVLADAYVYLDNGLIYKDFAPGDGAAPLSGQQVEFNYSAYNESGGLIDSSYRQGRPASTRLGIGGMIPGFEAGLMGMRVGGKRRIIVPPELGPPVGPATFFSARQFECAALTLLGPLSRRRAECSMSSCCRPSRALCVARRVPHSRSH